MNANIYVGPPRPGDLYILQVFSCFTLEEPVTRLHNGTVLANLSYAGPFERPTIGLCFLNLFELS